MFDFNLDGVTGSIKGLAWAAHGFVSINVYDEDKKAPLRCPKCGTKISHRYPSGWAYTFNISYEDIKRLFELTTERRWIMGELKEWKLLLSVLLLMS